MAIEAIGTGGCAPGARGMQAAESERAIRPQEARLACGRAATVSVAPAADRVEASPERAAAARAERLAAVRERVAEGYYDRPEIRREIAERLVQSFTRGAS